MQDLIVRPLGKVCVRESGVYIELDQTYIPALQALDGFSHINVIWWFSEFDNEAARSILEAPQPYKKAPQIMGIFATRSPLRPNPLGLTTVQVLDIDHTAGIIKIAYIDAHDQTPVLDIKPYTPSYDRVESFKVPQWCSHWPASLEESGSFNWEEEFNF